jgi:hypothetical protein
LPPPARDRAAGGRPMELERIGAPIIYPMFVARRAKNGLSVSGLIHIFFEGP